MRQRHKFKIERPHGECTFHGNDVQLHNIRDALFLKLAANERCSERRRVQRHAEVRGKIGNGANMVFMTMRQDDAQKVFFALLDKFQIWKDEVNAGIF